MKKTLLLFFFAVVDCVAQAPTITGDTMLCPDQDGTATVVGNQVYDSYTWYTKFWFTSDPFEVVPGVDGPSFTYDWFTYDQSLIKVVVTLNGETYESNTIQIDSYAWSGMIVSNEMGDHVTFDPDSESFVLCEGTAFTNEIFMPYTTNIQWYNNNQPIEGATNMSYQITEPGVYHVTAAPEFCPNNTSTSMPIVVTIDTDCNLEREQHHLQQIAISPNPVKNVLHITTGSATIDTVQIYTTTGQLVHTINRGTDIDTSNLSSGIYLLKINSDSSSRVFKFVKQ